MVHFISHQAPLHFLPESPITQKNRILINYFIIPYFSDLEEMGDRKDERKMTRDRRGRWDARWDGSWLRVSCASASSVLYFTVVMGIILSVCSLLEERKIVIENIGYDRYFHTLHTLPHKQALPLGSIRISWVEIPGDPGVCGRERRIKGGPFG
jgi:hypothetical protein